MRYTIFSGTNTWAECGQALRGLLGLASVGDGPDIEAYERMFARSAGTSHAFSLASGRMALYRILEALDIGAGDEVILPAFTCVVVPNAILYRGAVPVYVDIQPGTFNIDPALIEAKITPRTRAILAQHTFGLVCDIDAVDRIARRRSLTVIEDCAHALGAEHRGKKAGSLGRVSLFSTDHSKVISTGTGGMIATSDPALALRLEALQKTTPFLEPSRARRILFAFIMEHALLHPRVFRLGRWANKVFSRLGLYGYFPDELSVKKPTAYPYPARLSNAQARIGLSQLARLPDNIAWRHRAARLYAKARGAPIAEENSHAFLRYTFLVEDRGAWLELYADVLDMCIWFTSVLEGRSGDFEEVGYRPGSCPVAEDAARRCVNLPTHPRVTEPEELARRLKAALSDPSGRYL